MRFPRYIGFVTFVTIFLVGSFSLQVASANSQPTIASISNKIVVSGDRVRVRASASDLDGDALAFHWEQTNGNTIDRLRGVDSDTLSFTAPLVSSAEEYQFVLSVSDGQSNNQETVTVNVEAAENQVRAPSAVVGTDQEVVSGTEVYLDGSASHDEDSLALTFQWQQIAGSLVAFAPTQAKTSFFAPAVSIDTTLSFRLTVNDGSLSDTAETRVLIHPQSTATAPVSSAIPEITTSTKAPSLMPALTFIDASPTAKAGSTITLIAPEVTNASYFWRITNYPLTVSDSYSRTTNLTIPEDLSVGKEVEVDLTIYASSETIHKQHQILVLGSDVVKDVEVSKILSPTLSVQVPVLSPTTLVSPEVKRLVEEVSVQPVEVASSSGVRGTILNIDIPQPKVIVSAILVLVGLLCVFFAFYTGRKKIVSNKSSSL